MRTITHTRCLKLGVLACVLNFSIQGSAQLPPDPQVIKNLYNEVMAYTSHLPTDKNFKPTPPPSMYFDYCFPCDKERQNEFVRDSINFYDVYMGDETRYMKKANTVMEDFTNRKLKKGPYDSVAGKKMSTDMFQAKIKLSQRIQAKLMAAWSKYANIPEKVPFLIRKMIEQHRNNALVGVKSEASMPSVATLKQLDIIAKVKKFREARAQRDYTVLLNIDLILETFRTAASLSLSHDDIGDNEMEYANLSQFLFTIETKAKVNVENGSFGASLSNKSIFSAKPGKDCHLKWTQVDPSGTEMVYDLKEIFMTYAEADSKPVYVGPTSWSSPAPQIKLDFCDDTRDTAHFYGFNCPTGMESWTYKGHPLKGTACQMTYIICFPDKRPFSEFARGGVTTKPMIPFGFYVKQVPKNKQKVILDKTIDAKDFSDQAGYVAYGEFQLKIEHLE